MDVRSYSVDELQTIADEVGTRSGWDFSRMHTEREPVPWDYPEIVARYLTPTDTVLDVGTGGGERLLDLANRFGQGVGFDPDPDMVRVAQANATRTATTHVTFQQAGAEDLASFSPEMFDVVLTRHAPTSAPGLDRVAKPGGYFVCQGVGSRNMENIRLAFDTGSATQFDEDQRALTSELRESGWAIVAEGEYNVRYLVRDLPSLLFWFSAIAGANEVPSDFAIDRYHDVINDIIHRHGTDRGVETNEHRTLLIARKASNQSSE
ncbi:MAG: class I SAM-dependent methyltransferase [Thermomicrobiales bacterium]